MGTERKMAGELQLCGVVNCFNNSVGNRALTYFELPSDPYLEFLWLQRIQRERQDRKEILVCEIHFEGRLIKFTDTGKVLQAGAVPTLHLPDCNVIEIKQEPVGDDSEPATPPPTPTPMPAASYRGTSLTSSTSTQTVSTSTVKCQTSMKLLNDYIKQKEKAISEKCHKKIRQQELQEMNRLNAKYLNPRLARLIKVTGSLLKTTPNSRGNRYTWSQKFLGLHLQNISPAAHSFVRNIIQLPSLNLEKNNWLQVTLPTEMNENLIKTLQCKASMLSENQKYCILSLNTSIIKKVNLYYDVKEDRFFGLYDIDGIQKPRFAKVAIFASLHGIFDDWVQPISIALVANTKKDQNVIDWVNKIMLMVLGIGFDLRGVVTNMNLRYIATAKNITPDRPYFYLNDHKIYCYFDSSDLLRLIRDSFSKCDIHFNGCVAKWEDIRKCYNCDQTRLLKLAPKLSIRHLSPKGEKTPKTKMRLVTDTFSKAIATAITAFVDMKVMDARAKDTAQFLLQMEKLHDLFTSTYVFSNKFGFRRNYVGDMYQLSFLRDMQHFFDNVQLIDNVTGEDRTVAASFRYGFKVNITTLMSLYNEIGVGRKSLMFTKRLQNVSVERYYGKDRKSPSLAETIAAFRRRFLSDTVYVTGEMDQEKYDNVSKQLQDLITVCEQEDVSHSAVVVKDVDYKDIVLPQNNALLYTAGFLLVKCLKVHIFCEAMKNYVFNFTMQCGAGAESRESLAILPPADFLHFVETMEVKFKWYFENTHLSTKVISTLLDIYKNDVFNMPCSCFPIIYLKKLFIRIRIKLLIDFNSGRLRINSNEAYSVNGI